MLDPNTFGSELSRLGFAFYSGVPCSLLKSLINYSMACEHYLPAVNEGDAVAHCAGAWLGGKKSVVLMQNSGLGNAVSPLTSLNYIYNIPVLGFVSLRGDPDVQDEPQHELMGQITMDLLRTMAIPFEILSQDPIEAAVQLQRANAIVDSGQTFFFVVKKNTFKSFDTPVSEFPEAIQVQLKQVQTGARNLRKDVLQCLREVVEPNTIIMATTGVTGRELYQLGHRDSQFYMVGSMGCISPLAMGLAVARPDLKVIAVDGDGALLMRMGNMATLGCLRPANLLHLLLDNNAHESTGGQATVSASVNFAAIAAATGYPVVHQTDCIEHLQSSIVEWQQGQQLQFIHMNIAVGHAQDLIRPKEKPAELAQRFRLNINATKAGAPL